MINKEIHYFSDPLTLANGSIVQLRSGEYTFVRRNVLSPSRFLTEEEAIAGLNAENIREGKISVPFQVNEPLEVLPSYGVPTFFIPQTFSYEAFEEQVMDAFLKDDVIVGVYRDQYECYHPFIGMIDEPFMQTNEAVALVDAWFWLDGYRHATDSFLVELRQCERIDNPVPTLRRYIDYALDSRQEEYFHFLSRELRKFQ